MRADKKICETCRYSTHMQMFNEIANLVFIFYHLAGNKYFWFFLWFWLGFFGGGVHGFCFDSLVVRWMRRQ